MAAKISIQGVQTKLSATLRPSQNIFQVTDTGGQFILKPQSTDYPELPENEGLTMHLAKLAGLETPLSGLVYCKDGSFTYFIRRFDRLSRKKKLAVEDFAQLSGRSRQSKYDFSMERLIGILDQYCTFPVLEKRKLFRMVLFNFLIGNEDAHLKNYSLITRQDKVELSPVYDLLNTTIVLKSPQEEIALPLKGKMSNLRKKDLIDCFALQRLALNAKTVDTILQDLHQAAPFWQNALEISFLSDRLKRKYQDLMKDRFALLEI